MKKNTLLKKIETYGEKIEKALDDFRDFLDSVEDEGLSSMADEFHEMMLDIIHDGDIVNLNSIKEFVENVYEHE